MRIQHAVALFMLLVFLPVSASFAGMSASDPTVAKLSMLHGKAFDVAYLQAIIPSDDEAVEMAMTATLYADHSALLHWNQDYTEREHAQIKHMVNVLEQLGARATRNEGVATPSVKALRSVRGAALERKYVALMTAHFDHTVALSKLAASHSDRADIRSIAAGVVAADSKDAARLRGWVTAWYH
ncbi:MAG TPA: DUF305 domain-containing protein [bacterium]|nr:DUF305 domain-containing protein [bacterium]